MNDPQQPICPLCGSAHVLLFTIAKDYQNPHDEKAYYAYSCVPCQLLFQFPFPKAEDFDAIYPADYYAHVNDEAIPFLTRLLTSFLRGEKKLLSFVRPSLFPYFEEIKQSETVLDIGCGKGLFLDVLKAQGKKTYGLEPDAHAVQILAEKGHQAMQGETSYANYPDNFFDLVTMFQVFEHIEKPVETLHEIYRIIKPGGYFVLETPNIKSKLAKNANKWRSLELPRHVILHSPHSVNKLLKQEGFQPKIFVRVSPTDIKETIYLKKNITTSFVKKATALLLLPYIGYHYLFHPSEGSLLIAIAKKS